MHKQGTTMMTFSKHTSSAALLALLALTACNSVDAVSSAVPTTASAACPVVTGEIWYKVKIALPSDATINVRLEEQGIADVAAAVIGETKILSDGQQVPIAFSLQPDCTTLQKASMPGFTVRTEDNKGALMFINDTSFPLVLNGGTNRIEVVKVQ